MSKPISFGFSSRPKPSSTVSTPSTSKPSTPKPISFSSSSAGGRKPIAAGPANSKSSALRDDSEDEDEAPPKHEELTGFSSTGAILSRPKEEKTERVIQNAGNGDWRRRGKNLLPAEVQAAMNGKEVVTVEKDEVSKAHGLQFADKSKTTKSIVNSNTNTVMMNGDVEPEQVPQKEMTEDERALAALLDDGTGKPKSTATINVQANDDWQRSETDDFRADVVSRPDSSTLEEYAAMPVEEFGMAMLRGMGRKRRANGELIELNNKSSAEEDKKRKERKQEGFLGIGAKPVKGLEGVELGAWGKSDMRKNQRGEGFFTPVMVEDRRTGERITEEEFERRKKAAKRGEIVGGKANGEEDWRERRDRNLHKSGRDNDRNGGGERGNQVNGGSSRKRVLDERDHDQGSSPRSKRDQDQEREGSYDSFRSRRDRSRSRDRQRKDDGYKSTDRDRAKGRDRHRDGYRDEDRYDSSSSRRSEHRHRDREREKDRDRDDRRHRDRR